MATANQPVKEVVVVKRREGFPWNFFRFIRGIIFCMGLMVIASFILIGVAIAWGGLVLAYLTDWPTSFFITALGAGVYISAAVADKLRKA